MCAKTANTRQIEGDFEKGEADGSAASLDIIAIAARAWRGLAARGEG